MAALAWARAPGAGGAAASSLTFSEANSASLMATISATGGGAGGGINSNGAKATDAVAGGTITGADMVTVTITAAGGNGGTAGYAESGSGEAGGKASASGLAKGQTVTTLGIQATGGLGEMATAPAKAPAREARPAPPGAPSLRAPEPRRSNSPRKALTGDRVPRERPEGPVVLSLANAVSGMTDGGTLSLNQTALGGGGGQGDGAPGMAGTAESDLVFTDLKNAAASAAVSGAATAVGRRWQRQQQRGRRRGAGRRRLDDHRVCDGEQHRHRYSRRGRRGRRPAGGSSPSGVGGAASAEAGGSAQTLTVSATATGGQGGGGEGGGARPAARPRRARPAWEPEPVSST